MILPSQTRPTKPFQVAIIAFLLFVQALLGFQLALHPPSFTHTRAGSQRSLPSQSRLHQEACDEFIARCSLNPIGRYVKIRDLEDNLDVTRLTEVDSDSADRINRYLKALRFLKGLTE